MGRKLGALPPLRGGGAGSPSNTHWPGLRPTCVPSFILIHPTVWPKNHENWLIFDRVIQKNKKVATFFRQDVQVKQDITSTVFTVRNHLQSNSYSNSYYTQIWHLMKWKLTKLDSMHGSSHQHRTSGGPRPRERLPTKMPHFFVFCPWWPWPRTPKFELWRDFCTVQLTAKFHHPMFNRSEAIVLTSKQNDKQTDGVENMDHLAPLCYTGG